MTFDTVAGGGVREFYDLASGENRTLDLVVGSFGPKALAFDTAQVSGGWYNTGSNDTDAKLDLIEATGTRVIVRQEAFYQDEAGPVAEPGVTGFGDYAIYGTGRIALERERRSSSTIATVRSSDGNPYQLNVTAPVPTDSVTLGDGGGAVGDPTVDLLNSMIYVGTDRGVIYGVQFPLP
jgi:hypothetical protein